MVYERNSFNIYFFMFICLLGKTAKLLEFEQRNKRMKMGGLVCSIVQPTSAPLGITEGKQ